MNDARVLVAPGSGRILLAAALVVGWSVPSSGGVLPSTGPARSSPGAAAPASRQEAGAPGEDLFMAAESLWSAGDLRGALRRFDELVARYPSEDYPDLSWRTAAHIRGGEIRLRLGRIEDAAGSFITALDDEPPSAWTARARLGLATSLLHRGRWEAAADLLQRVVNATEAGGADADLGTSTVARHRLSFVHRMHLRPAAGMLPWQATLAVAVPRDTLDDPIGVAASTTGLLLITDEGSDLVVLVGADGNVRRMPEPDVRLPWWDGDGIGYVATRNGTLMPQRNERLHFPTPGRPERPLENVKVGGRGTDGEWLLLDERQRRVMRFGPDGAYLGELALGADARPVDLAIDTLGRIYVLDERRRSVLRLTPEGVLEGSISVPDWRRPSAVEVDMVGNLFVLDRDTKRIHVFDPQGGALWTLGPTLPGGTELRDPRDLAVDGSGRLYVAERDLGVVLEVR